jgi:hypothetical protein
MRLIYIDQIYELIDIQNMNCWSPEIKKKSDSLSSEF